MKKNLFIFIAILSLVGFVGCDGARQQQEENTFQTEEYREDDQQQMQDDVIEDEYQPQEDDAQLQEDVPAEQGM